MGLVRLTRNKNGISIRMRMTLVMIFSNSLPLYIWTPKVCKIVAFMAALKGLGLLFYILLGFRYIYSLNLRSERCRINYSGEVSGLGLLQDTK